MYDTEQYDYAQPTVYGAGASVGSQQSPIQLENPFGTDAEACIEFFYATGLSGVVAIASDTAPSLSSNNISPLVGPAANGAMGYVFPVPLISGFHSDYYFPVKQFLNLIASLTAQSGSTVGENARTVLNLASAARATYSQQFTVGDLTELALDFNVTALTGGTSPTVTFKVSRIGADGIVYQIDGGPTPLSAPGVLQLNIGVGSVNNRPFGDTIQVDMVVTGAPTSITFSGSIKGKGPIAATSAANASFTLVIGWRRSHQVYKPDPSQFYAISEPSM